MVGAKRRAGTKEEIERLPVNEKATKGHIYSYRYFNDKLCNGADVKNHSFFDTVSYFEWTKEFNIELNDCLIHAVNFALRFPWFTHREQVVRLR